MHNIQLLLIDSSDIDVYIYVYIYTCIWYIYIYIHIYICVYVCIYVYIYNIYIYIYRNVRCAMPYHVMSRRSIVSVSVFVMVVVTVIVVVVIVTWLCNCSCNCHGNCKCNCSCGSRAVACHVRPISLLSSSLRRLLDSNIPADSLWAWEFHPVNLILCLSQTSRNP